MQAKSTKFPYTCVTVSLSSPQYMCMCLCKCANWYFNVKTLLDHARNNFYPNLREGHTNQKSQTVWKCLSIVMMMMMMLMHNWFWLNQSIIVSVNRLQMKFLRKNDFTAFLFSAVEYEYEYNRYFVEISSKTHNIMKIVSRFIIWIDCAFIKQNQTKQHQANGCWNYILMYLNVQK